jgi:trehalose-phosphatase
MKLINPKIDLEAYFVTLSRAAERILIVDYDGTLAPFRTERDRAVPYPDVPPLIDRIMKKGNCRVIVVSGRNIADVKPLLGFAATPEIWGCHGWERLMPDGSYAVPEISARYRDGLHDAFTWARTKGLASRCESKFASIAFHWRGIDPGSIPSIREAIEEGWRSIAERSGFQLAEFNGGLELRIPGRDKGTAIEAIRAEAGEGAAMAYLGDDFTDEDAFEALGGGGLRVLVNETFHETAADLWLIPPGELLDFLSRWADACGEEQ